MKNRPREIQRLLKLAALTAAKKLYPEPKYNVNVYNGDIYVVRVCSGEIQLVIYEALVS
jgi:hypothetical protein